MTLEESQSQLAAGVLNENQVPSDCVFSQGLGKANQFKSSETSNLHFANDLTSPWNSSMTAALINKKMLF